MGRKGEQKWRVEWVEEKNSPAQRGSLKHARYPGGTLHNKSCGSSVRYQSRQACGGREQNLGKVYALARVSDSGSVA